MANIILSEGSNKLNALYGNIQHPIARFLEKRAEAFEAQSIAKEIFVKRPSTHWAEGYTGLTAMDDFEPTPENGDYPTNGYEQGYDQVIRNMTWKSSFSISREMMEDGNVIDMRKKPEAFLTAWYRTQERFFAQMLGTAINGAVSFKRKGIEFSCKSADGVCQFAQNHKPKVKGGNQSNYFSDAFSADALGKAATAMQNFHGDNGETLGLIPDTIIIPNDAELKAEVFGVLGAHRDPETAAGNKYNYLFGNWNVWVWPYLNDFITKGTKPWVILDSNYNQMADGAVWQDRTELEVRSELAANDANQWKGYARFGGGFIDFRAMACGGMTGGSTL